MKCKQCGAEIGRGERYHSPTLTSYCWCSQDCYESYCAAVKRRTSPATPRKFQPTTDTTEPQKGRQRCDTASQEGSDIKPSSYRRLCDLIDSVYPTTPNWNWLTAQIKNIKSQYKLTDNQVRLIIRYAVELEGVEINSEYGLGQIFPRYIEPGLEFIASLKRVSNIDDETLSSLGYGEGEGENVVVIPPTNARRRKFWGDLSF